MGLYPKNLNEYVASLGIPRGPKSQAYLVDPSNGNDDWNGKSWKRPVASLEAGEDLLVANQNDVLLYLGGSSGNTLAAAMAWDKNYTHLIGLCAPTNVAQRSRIFQAAALTGASPLLTISATGCIFKDWYIFQGVDDATSLLNVSVTGGRNYFKNVHFAGGGHATQAVNGGASLHLNGAEENVFDGCTIGVDTIAAGTGMVGLLFDDEAHRNTFRNSKIQLYAGHIGAAFVEIVDGTGIDRWNSFENVKFINSNLDNFTMASAFLIPEFAGNNSSRLLLDSQCSVLGATKLDADDRGVLYGNLNAITGADLSGVSVELIT